MCRMQPFLSSRLRQTASFIPVSAIAMSQIKTKCVLCCNQLGLIVSLRVASLLFARSDASFRANHGNTIRGKRTVFTRSLLLRRTWTCN